MLGALFAYAPSELTRSAAGAGFVFEQRYALPITAAAFAAAVGGLSFGARRWRSAAPLALGIAGSLVGLTGRFALASDMPFYAGLTAVIGAPLWNAFSRYNERACACAGVADPRARPRHISETGGREHENTSPYLRNAVLWGAATP